METADQNVRAQRVTAELVLRELRKHDFAVVSTVSEEGQPFSAGVNYGVSEPGRELALYVMTRRHLRKVQNIARNPSISLVVPLSRRFLRFLPPATIQLRGRAETLDWTDQTGTKVFKGFWMGRRILEAYEQSRLRGETRVCFLKITPDPVVHTYMVGYGIWQLRKRMEEAAATVAIGPGHRSSPLGTKSERDDPAAGSLCRNAMARARERAQPPRPNSRMTPPA